MAPGWTSRPPSLSGGTAPFDAHEPRNKLFTVSCCNMNVIGGWVHIHTYHTYRNMPHTTRPSIKCHHPLSQLLFVSNSLRSKHPNSTQANIGPRSSMQHRCSTWPRTCVRTHDEQFNHQVVCIRTVTVVCSIQLSVVVVYKVPLREEARGVAQEQNEKHPAWNEYHYAGNRRIKIVFGYLVRTNTLINKRTLHFRTGRYLFFAYTWRQTLWSYVIFGYFVQYYIIVEAGS